MIATGIATLYHVTETAVDGGMPTRKLSSFFHTYFADRRIGITRIYAAKGVKKRIDRVIRIEYTEDVLADDIAILDDGKQYRIDIVHQVEDENDLYCTELTLERLETYYDVPVED